MAEVQGKFNLLIIKSNSRMVLQNWLEFSEQYNNHGNIVRLYRNNTTAQVNIYTRTLMLTSE